MQCDAEITKQKLWLVVHHDLYFATPISIPACCTSLWAFNFGTKVLPYFIYHSQTETVTGCTVVL